MNKQNGKGILIQFKINSLEKISQKRHNENKSIIKQINNTIRKI